MVNNHPHWFHEPNSERVASLLALLGDQHYRHTVNGELVPLSPTLIAKVEGWDGHSGFMPKPESEKEKVTVRCTTYDISEIAGAEIKEAIREQLHSSGWGNLVHEGRTKEDKRIRDSAEQELYYRRREIWTKHKIAWHYGVSELHSSLYYAALRGIATPALFRIITSVGGSPIGSYCDRFIGLETIPVSELGLEFSVESGSLGVDRHQVSVVIQEKGENKDLTYTPVDLGEALVQYFQKAITCPLQELEPQWGLGHGAGV